jgi:hypothetical protein
MKLARLIRGTVVTMTCLSMLTVQFAQAAQPVVRDVALRSSGVLQGQVLDTQGAPQAGLQVTLAQHGKAIAVANTGIDGRFQMANLSAGVYEMQTPMGSNVYRLWAPRTAPPSAQDGVLIVAGEEYARGQHGCLGLLANPWVLAAIVAAAIAIPLAIDDNDDAS